MSKAKLIFDLSDPDDLQKFKRTIKVDDMASVIWEYLRNTRKEIDNHLEFKTEGTEDAFKAVEMCFERFTGLLEEHNIDIDEIY